MAVYIWEDDAFEKMVQVEGEDWRRDVKNFGCCSFDAFKEKFDRLNFSPEKIQELIRKDISGEGIEAHLSVDGNSAIYGYGGWNRYVVRYSGEIMFLKAFCEEPEYLQKARELGFTIR